MIDYHAAIAPDVMGDVLESLDNEGGSQVVVWSCKVVCPLVAQKGYSEHRNQRSVAEADGRNKEPGKTRKPSGQVSGGWGLTVSRHNLKRRATLRFARFCSLSVRKAKWSRVNTVYKSKH